MGWLSNVIGDITLRFRAGLAREDQLRAAFRERLSAPTIAAWAALSGRRRSWRGDAEAGKSLCIFASFDPGNRVDDYVFTYLEKLRACDYAIDFVSGASSISPADLARLQSLCRKIHVRENTGRDFGHFKYGLSQAGNLTKFETVLITNDSIYGPVFDLRPIIQKMDTDACDFWGVTDSWDQSYHIHSFFVVFKKSCFTSAAFTAFWDSFEYRNDKKYVIAAGEVRLTRYLMNKGMRPGVYIPYMRLVEDALASDLEGTTLGVALPEYAARLRATRLALQQIDQETGRIRDGSDGASAAGSLSAGVDSVATVQAATKILETDGFNHEPWRRDMLRLLERDRLEHERYDILESIRTAAHNSLHFFWKELIENHHCPFLKIELVRYNPARVLNLGEWRSLLTRLSDYDTGLILRHQMRVSANKAP